MIFLFLIFLKIIRLYLNNIIIFFIMNFNIAGKINVFLMLLSLLVLAGCSSNYQWGWYVILPNNKDWTIEYRILNWWFGLHHNSIGNFNYNSNIFGLNCFCCKHFKK